VPWDQRGGASALVSPPPVLGLSLESDGERTYRWDGLRRKDWLCRKLVPTPAHVLTAGCSPVLSRSLLSVPRLPELWNVVARPADEMLGVPDISY
jgi:hypothetical protein